MKYSMQNGLTCSLNPATDIQKIEFILAKQPVESITSVYKRTGCHIIFNANFFNMKDGTTCGEVTDEHKVISHGMSPYGYAFVDKKIPVFSFKNDVNAVDFVGGYPCLLKDNSIYIDTKEYGFSEASTKVLRGRTACGSNDGLFVVRVIPDSTKYSRKSTKGMALELKSLGCKDGVNYDGGGSSQYITPWGKHISGRSCDGYICIWLTTAALTPSTSPVRPSDIGNVIHTVKPGETLSGIAKKYGTTYMKIAKDNGISNPNIIRVGQKLKIYK